MKLGRKLIVASLIAAGPAIAAPKALTLGQTFPIAEQDALSEIQAKASQKDWQSWMRKPVEKYSAFQSVNLPKADKDDSRLFDPTYPIPADIPDQNGKVIFPKGTLVNIYTKITVPGRYIVIGPEERDFKWLDEVAKPTALDKVLLASGNVYLVRQSTRRNVYVLDTRFVERFGLQKYPAIVQQEGTQLRVREYAIDSKGKGE